MSLLIDLLKSSSKEELSLLYSELKLKGKERIVFDFLVENMAEMDNLKLKSMQSLVISSTHFDKINNVLLRKCYSILGGEGTELLSYLNQKLLIKHLLHEIKLQEKVSVGKTIPVELSKLYFEMIVNVPAKYYSEQHALEYGKKLIKSAKNNLNIKTYVECRLLYARLNIIRHGKPTRERLIRITEKIEAFKKLKQAHNFEPEVQLWIFKTLAFFYTRIVKDPDKHFNYLKKIKILYESDNLLPLKEKALNDCNIASHYYDCNELLNAQKCYKESFGKYSYLISSEVRHIARFIEVCVLLKDFKLAIIIYKKWLLIYYHTEHEAFGVLACLVYSKYLIHCGNYKKALVVIHQGIILNSRMVYYKYDIELRMLENTIFALRKDFDYALDLALKNLKYISSQGLSIKKYMHAHFFRLLINVIYNLKEGVPYSSQTVRYYKEYQQGELLIYGLLIKKIKNKGRLNL